MHSATIPPWLLIPFGIMLLAIAILPLVANHWWEHNRNKFVLSLLLGLPVAIALFVFGLEHKLADVLVFEYIPFVVLLGSLYTISGGILISGNLVASPLVNTLFLLTGTLLASVVGTTGAAMLLIRPFLTTNRGRSHKVHSVVFFIFLVCNIGGSLTPIGDPPLFLGYLKGVPFFWTLRLFPEWLFASAILLAVYFIWDTILYRRESPLLKTFDIKQRMSIRVDGKFNILLLLGVVVAVIFINSRFLSWVPKTLDPYHLSHYLAFTREGLMVALTLVSLKFTHANLRRANSFNFHPILEVAALFLGIFVTMVPALVFLQSQAHLITKHISTPAQFFWATGLLSSFLDNAPTYVTMFTAAGVDVNDLASYEITLVAISLGAVFMGANTYIGNGPNFMVRSVAESSGVRMPSFFGYMAYSALILIPLFIVLQLVFM